MVRGVIVVFFTMFIVILGLMLGVAVIEPLADEVETHDSIDEGDLSGTSYIDDVKTSIFEYMPVVVIAGIILWAFRWYLRKERFVGGRR